MAGCCFASIAHSLLVLLRGSGQSYEVDNTIYVETSGKLLSDPGQCNVRSREGDAVTVLF